VKCQSNFCHRCVLCLVIIDCDLLPSYNTSTPIYDIMKGLTDFLYRLTYAEKINYPQLVTEFSVDCSID